jgi:hypothetical protein
MDMPASAQTGKPPSLNYARLPARSPNATRRSRKIARNRTLAKCINERNAAVAKRALAGHRALSIRAVTGLD